MSFGDVREHEGLDRGRGVSIPSSPQIRFDGVSLLLLAFEADTHRGLENELHRINNVLWSNSQSCVSLPLTPLR